MSDEEGHAGQQTQAPPQRRPSPIGPPTSSARGRPPPGAAAASMQAKWPVWRCSLAQPPCRWSSRQTDTSAACKRHKLPKFAFDDYISSQQVQGDTDSEAARRRALAKLEGDDSQMHNSVKVHRGCAAPALYMSNAVGPCPAKRAVTANCVWVVAGIRQAGGSACQRRVAEGAALPCTVVTVSLVALTWMSFRASKSWARQCAPQVAGLWGNAQGVIRAAAQSVTETVEEGVRDVSSLHAVKAASGCAAAA